MSYRFERPVGAAADARELEYIAALHQTDDKQDNSWMDGSIEAEDVKNFLLSRYGIKVTKEEVTDLIFADMGGGDTDDECIDLTEVVAILIIPYLAKINFNNKGDLDNYNFQSQFEIDAFTKSKKLRGQMQEANKILSDVLCMILRNATKSDNVKSQPLTRDLLRRIFMHYGEHELLQDDRFIDEMIAAAGGTELNAETFLHALTHDIQLYNATNESRFQTHYEDVFGLVTYDDGIDEQYNSNADNAPNYDDTEHGHGDEAYDLAMKGGENHRTVKRIFTFPQIDFLADSFRSRSQYVFMWLTVVLGYFSWFEFGDWGIRICSKDKMDKFGCQVGNSIAIWFAVMASMIFIVVPKVSLLSLGNNVYSHSKYEIIASIVAIVVLVIIPPSLRFDWTVINTYEQYQNGGEFLYPVAQAGMLTLGCILLLLQVCNVIRFVVPDSRLTKSKILTNVLRGSSVRSEFGIKQAAVYKVHQMVKNAYELHLIDTNKRESTRQGLVDDNDEDELTSDPLLNFTRVTEKRESSGGFLWAWKLLLSGNLIETEGIWLHTKLLAGNFVQIIATLGAAFFAFMLVTIVEREITASIADSIEGGGLTSTNDTTVADSCYSSFNPSKCYFPESNGTSLGIGLCTEIFLSNTECESNFVVTAGATYDAFCDAFLDAADELPPPASLYFNDECPALYMPFENFYSVTEESNEELFCVGNLGACTAPVTTESGLYFDACMLGSTWRLPAPFQFTGDLCQNYTELEQLLETKEAAADAVMDFVPKKWVWYTSLFIGILCILLVGTVMALSTIPSMIVTTLKFRSGVIGSLRDPYFKKYRQGLLATTFLLGASFWGSLISSGVVFFFSFVLTFITVYPVTRPFILTFLSLLIGVSVTLTVKIVLSMFLNKYNFVGFYRKRPLVANISSLCFECWHLALTSSYIILRVVKLFIIIIVYVGRFDTPVLAQGVGEIGPIKLDAFPFIFKQDLLAIDAHRHPYIERLGMMYIMKLKYGDNFAKKTGSIWRLLFVFALFPWLRQYRILNNDEINLEEELNSANLDGNRSSLLFKEKIAALNAKVKRLTAMNKNLVKRTA